MGVGPGRHGDLMTVPKRIFVVASHHLSSNNGIAHISLVEAFILRIAYTTPGQNTFEKLVLLQ